MANAMILNRKYKNVSIQTGEDNELFVYLNNKKTARIYFSPAYKDKVLSFNFGTSKSFIFTKSMWKNFKIHLADIDKILNDD